jgi:hypothetical protein
MKTATACLKESALLNGTLLITAKTMTSNHLVTSAITATQTKLRNFLNN